MVSELEELGRDLPDLGLLVAGVRHPVEEPPGAHPGGELFAVETRGYLGRPFLEAGDPP